MYKCEKRFEKHLYAESHCRTKGQFTRHLTDEVLATRTRSSIVPEDRGRLGRCATRTTPRSFAVQGHPQRSLPDLPLNNPRTRCDDIRLTSRTVKNRIDDFRIYFLYPLLLSTTVSIQMADMRMDLSAYCVRIKQRSVLTNSIRPTCFSQILVRSQLIKFTLTQYNKFARSSKTLEIKTVSKSDVSNNISRLSLWLCRTSATHTQLTNELVLSGVFKEEAHGTRALPEQPNFNVIRWICSRPVKQ